MPIRHSVSPVGTQNDRRFAPSKDIGNIIAMSKAPICQRYSLPDDLDLCSQSCSWPHSNPSRYLHSAPIPTTTCYFERPKREFRRATVHGAIVTVVLVGAVFALIWRELAFSMKTEIVEQLFVNSTINPTVNVT